MRRFDFADGLVTSLAVGCLLGACAAPSAPTPPSEGEADIVVGASLRLESAVLGETRTINVYLPWGYEEREERFPVLYLIDGGVRQDFVPVAGFGALAALTAQYREFILVGVQTDDRRFELTTPSEVAYDLEQIPRNGGADEFRRFVVEEVRPAIERRYRTSGETAVLGESLAGFFITDTFLRAPESFDHYIAVSPSVWWEDGALTRAAAERLRAPDFPDGRSLYLTVADETDIQSGLGPLVTALEDHAPAGLRWWFRPLPEEHHHTIYHPATLDALRLIFAAQAQDGP